MDYKIAGQDVATIIKEHNLSKKYALSAEELRQMEGGYADAGLIIKFLKVAAGEKDKFSPQARAEIENKFEPALEKIKQIHPEIVEMFINSGIVDRALGPDINKLPEKIELIIRGDQQLKEVGTALNQGTISKEEAESFASSILTGISKAPKAAPSIKQIIEEGKQPNRGGREHS